MRIGLVALTPQWVMTQWWSQQPTHRYFPISRPEWLTMLLNFVWTKSCFSWITMYNKPILNWLLNSTISLGGWALFYCLHQLKRLMNGSCCWNVVVETFNHVVWKTLNKFSTLVGNDFNNRPPFIRYQYSIINRSWYHVKHLIIWFHLNI